MPEEVGDAGGSGTLQDMRDMVEEAGHGQDMRDIPPCVCVSHYVLSRRERWCKGTF